MKDELKTLNEIKIDSDKYIGIAFKNREDQKTEEDKKIWDKEGDIIFVSDIKELLIKWIKELASCYKSELNGMSINDMQDESDESVSMIKVLMNIFNISEKDLE